MRPRLGELLIREKLITPEQLEAALKAQVIFGGRLGTNLVETMGLDLDALARVLSSQHGQLPAALEKHFAQIQPAVVAMIPPKLAIKHEVIPLGISVKAPKTLAVAFMSPNPSAVDELAFAAGCRIYATIAPELRILYNLEKHFGVQRKRRFLRIAPDPPTPPPGVTEQRRYAEPLTASVYRDLVETASGGLEVAVDDPPFPNPRAPAPGPAERIAAAADALADDEEVLQPEAIDEQVIRPALTVTDALAKIPYAASREEIGDRVIDYLRSGFGVGLALIVKEEMALGWRGFAPGVDSSVVESIAIPLQSPSMLKLAVERRVPFRGAPPPEGAALHSRLYKLLRCPPPQEVLVAPVMLKDRVVLLVYAHAPGGTTMPENALGEIAAITGAAALGFVRLIHASKGPR